MLRNLLLFTTLLIVFASCSNSAKTTAGFCDTTCSNDSIIFSEPSKLKPTVSISMRDCYPDTLTWTHEALDMNRQVQMSSFLGKHIKLNRKAIACFIKDTSYAWLSFNDCITGRGYLFKLPFNHRQETIKSTGALNSFDPKFYLEDDLRAYTDRGSIFVVDVKTNKEAQMSFKEAYDMDFDHIHEVVDTIHITHKRIFVKLTGKDGNKIPFEKNIDL